MTCLIDEKWEGERGRVRVGGESRALLCRGRRCKSCFASYEKSYAAWQEGER